MVAILLDMTVRDGGVGDQESPFVLDGTQAVLVDGWDMHQIGIGAAD